MSDALLTPGERRQAEGRSRVDRFMVCSWANSSVTAPACYVGVYPLRTTMTAADAPRITIDNLQASRTSPASLPFRTCNWAPKAGKPYLKMLIGEGPTHPGRMWSATEELYQSLPTDGFVYLEGQTQLSGRDADHRALIGITRTELAAGDRRRRRDVAQVSASAIDREPRVSVLSIATLKMAT